MKKKKKILSIFISAILAIGILPSAIFAQNHLTYDDLGSVKYDLTFDDIVHFETSDDLLPLYNFLYAASSKENPELYWTYEHDGFSAVYLNLPPDFNDVQEEYLESTPPDAIILNTAFDKCIFRCPISKISGSYTVTLSEEDLHMPMVAMVSPRNEPNNNIYSSVTFDFGTLKDTLEINLARGSAQLTGSDVFRLNMFLFLAYTDCRINHTLETPEPDIFNILLDIHDNGITDVLMTPDTAAGEFSLYIGADTWYWNEIPYYLEEGIAPMSLSKTNETTLKDRVTVSIEDLLENEELMSTFDINILPFKSVTFVFTEKSSGGGSGHTNTPKLFKVSFDTQGGEQLKAFSKPKGTEINPNDYKPVKEGSEFEGWYFDKDYTKKAETFILKENVTLYAKWKDSSGQKDPEPKPDKKLNPFKDINEKDWFYKDVIEMYEKEYMSGTGSDTFSPYLATERAMIIQVLYNMEGAPEVEIPEPLPYPDLGKDEWYVKAVVWATKEGVAHGYDDGMFKPDQAVSRQELTQFIFEYAKYKGLDLTKKNDLSEFKDSNNVGSWARPAVEWAVGNEIILGADALIRPRDTATRAELAAMFNRLDKLIPRAVG